MTIVKYVNVEFLATSFTKTISIFSHIFEKKTKINKRKNERFFLFFLSVFNDSFPFVICLLFAYYFSPLLFSIPLFKTNHLFIHNNVTEIFEEMSDCFRVILRKLSIWDHKQDKTVEMKLSFLLPKLLH